MTNCNANILATYYQCYVLLGSLTDVFSEDRDEGLLEETARFIFSTATSTSSSVTVNYLIPILLFASNCDVQKEKLEIHTFEISVPVLYFVFRLGLFNLDDALGMTSGLDLSGYNAPSAGYGAPAPSYNAPAPSYNAPAPSYSAPAPSPSYNSNGAGLTSLTSNSGAFLRSKEDEAVGYNSQWNLII